MILFFRQEPAYLVKCALPNLSLSPLLTTVPYCGAYVKTPANCDGRQLTLHAEILNALGLLAFQASLRWPCWSTTPRRAPIARTGPDEARCSRQQSWWKAQRQREQAQLLPVFDRFDFDPRFRQMQSRFRTQVGHHVDFNGRGIEPVGANSKRRQAVP